jgi:hypothetical protein
MIRHEPSTRREQAQSQRLLCLPSRSIGLSTVLKLESFEATAFEQQHRGCGARDVFRGTLTRTSEAQLPVSLAMTSLGLLRGPSEHPRLETSNRLYSDPAPRRSECQVFQVPRLVS